MGDIYVILLKNDVLDGKTYRSFDEAKQALIDTAMAKEWRLEDDAPIVGFKNKFGFNDDDETEPVDFPKEGENGLTDLYAKGDDIDVQPINIRKLTVPATANGGRRRKTARTIRMKKSEYLREHHHLFRVLRNPTRRALNAELRKQQRELKERGLKG
jgi:hypothetical protein